MQDQSLRQRGSIMFFGIMWCHIGSFSVCREGCVTGDVNVRFPLRWKPGAVSKFGGPIKKSKNMSKWGKFNLQFK
jgi:hypothetical protein